MAVLNAYGQAVVEDSIFKNTTPGECEPSGRPTDPVAQSWWDAGFRCVGYVPPPKKNFDNYINDLEKAEKMQRISNATAQARQKRLLRGISKRAKQLLKDLEDGELPKAVKEELVADALWTEVCRAESRFRSWNKRGE